MRKTASIVYLIRTLVLSELYYVPHPRARM